MYRANNVRVIDGDTLVANIDLGFNVWLHDQSIRLADIDTPELKSKDPHCLAASHLARNRVIELIDGKPISFNGQKREKFGRILATVFTHDQVNINQTLVAERLAVDYFGKSKNVEKQLENVDYLFQSGRLI